MKDILSEIIAHKRIEIELQKQTISLEHLQEQAEIMLQAGTAADGSHCCRSMKYSLANSDTGIISEFKRRSPSKGWINEGAKAEIIPASYEAAGAAAISILTDEKFFGGSLRDIRTARPLVNIPILRKDFIIDEYQLLQARIVGADAVLLIAACLTPEQCSTLTAKAHVLGLEVLLEIHSPSELVYVNNEIDMVGVNNRNLGSFVTDIENSFRIADQLRETVQRTSSASGNHHEFPLLVSESGISSPETIRRLRNAGFRGFLIGETFMKTASPGETLQNMIATISHQSLITNH